MTLSKRKQFGAVADHLAERRDPILRAWKRKTCADPDQVIARSLSHRQFLDHIPEMLDAFERKLRVYPEKPDVRTDKLDSTREEEHGLHRWQQGYRMEELVTECGLLQNCIFDELDRITAKHPEIGHAVHSDAQRLFLTLIIDTIKESAAQYHRMQQAEAAGHMGDLRSALDTSREFERLRTSLFHQVVHDLGNDIAGVHISAKLLEQPVMADAERTEFVDLLNRGLENLTFMLGELMDLARLEAGLDKRKLAGFDAAALIKERCEVNQSLARESNLYLEVEGPPKLKVHGDAGKVGRILQNLLTNSLKYTTRGGISVSWDVNEDTWWFIVKDTGPGLLSSDNASFVSGLHEATASAKSADENSDGTSSGAGETSQVLAPPDGADTAEGAAVTAPTGEGIGLSIVKRLCELLEASLEIASSDESGTTFRVVFPVKYRSER
ncbi:MAG: sensor histidine kinase [Kiritimatiellia bacterium]